MTEYRYLLQSVPSREWIYLDLPLTGVSITDTVNGPGDISGVLPIQYSTRKKSNNQLALSEYGAMLHVERDGEIIASGIVDQIEIQGDSLSIAAVGWSAYPSEQPYEGKKKTYVSTDPARIIKDCWDYLLGFPDALPNVSIDSLNTGTTVGKPEGRNLSNAKTKLNNDKKRLAELEKAVQTANNNMTAKKKAVFKAAKRNSIGEVILQSSTPSGKKAAKNNIFQNTGTGTNGGKVYYHNGTSWIEIKTNVAGIKSAISAYQSSKTSYDNATQKVKDQKAVIKTSEDKVKDLDAEKAEPIVLDWSETDDLQKVINDMVEASGLQYRERSSWDGDDIRYRLQMAKPLGARRENLHFEIGINVLASPTVNFTEYASGVLLLGAGEGDARIRTSKNTTTGKLRRVTVQSAPQATTKAKADKEASNYLKNAQAERSIQNLSVVNHPNAPFGTFSPGDEIRVIGDAGWVDLDTWVHIKKITYSPDLDTAELEVSVV